MEDAVSCSFPPGGGGGLPKQTRPPRCTNMSLAKAYAASLPPATTMAEQRRLKVSWVTLFPGCPSLPSVASTSTYSPENSRSPPCKMLSTSMCLASPNVNNNDLEPTYRTLRCTKGSHPSMGTDNSDVRAAIRHRASGLDRR